MAEWTKDPKETGAYWYKIGGLGADILWVHKDRVYGVVNTPSLGTVADHLVPGAMFYGPLDQPPPMPSEWKSDKWSDCE